MLSQEELKLQFNYNKTTGNFTNKIRAKGKIAGSLDRKSSYIRITINDKKYMAHRLVWLYLYGKMPIHIIDHKNHNRQDNRLCNLSEVTHKENHKNRSKPTTNTSGHMGVSWDISRKKWRATIRILGKNKCLGRFSNKNDAITARKSANIIYEFHANHGK